MTRRRILAVTVAVIVALAAVAGLTAVISSAMTTTQVRQTQQVNTKKADARTQTLALVRDCVTPGGKCYERGQRQTAAAVADINRVTVLAAACADKPAQQTQDEIYACVVRRLAADKHKP